MLGRSKSLDLTVCVFLNQGIELFAQRAGNSSILVTLTMYFLAKMQCGMQTVTAELAIVQ